jgi:hypothetical protein
MNSWEISATFLSATIQGDEIQIMVSFDGYVERAEGTATAKGECQMVKIPAKYERR